MSDEPRETTRRPDGAGWEQKSAAEWTAATAALLAAGTNLYQAVKPSGQAPPPQPEEPEVILPPGVNQD